MATWLFGVGKNVKLCSTINVRVDTCVRAYVRACMHVSYFRMDVCVRAHVYMNAFMHVCVLFVCTCMCSIYV